MADAAGNNKRSRDETAELHGSKRLREADLILDLLDRDEVAPGDDLAGFIESFEEEIPSLATAADVNGIPLPDLGYLLEASDDELGLPPAVGSSPSPSSGGGEAVEIAGEEPAVVRFCDAWRLEDELFPSSYDDVPFGVLTETYDGVIFNDGLFDFSDVVCEPLGHEWVTESLGPVSWTGSCCGCLIGKDEQ